MGKLFTRRAGMKKILATAEKEIKQIIFPTMRQASEATGVDGHKISRAIYTGNTENGYFFDELFDLDALIEEKQEQLKAQRRLEK
jgi:DNA polymerase elongation subunit (family B)